jgi:hypothetical protein
MLTPSGNEVGEIDLRRAGYCQYCGIEGAHVELFRPETVPFESRPITFRTRLYYACGHLHFEACVREEARAEIWEQCEAQLRDRRKPDSMADGLPSQLGHDTSVEWRVMDRYCWFCGTHGKFNSMTRCTKCGELQRLYIRSAEGAS